MKQQKQTDETCLIFATAVFKLQEDGVFCCMGARDFKQINEQHMLARTELLAYIPSWESVMAVHVHTMNLHPPYIH